MSVLQANILFHQCSPVQNTNDERLWNHEKHQADQFDVLQKFSNRAEAWKNNLLRSKLGKNYLLEPEPELQPRKKYSSELEPKHAGVDPDGEVVEEKAR